MDTPKQRGRPRKYKDLPTKSEVRRPRGRPRKYNPADPIDAPVTRHDMVTKEWKAANMDRYREYQREYQREYRKRKKERCKEISRESNDRAAKYATEYEYEA